ncbi:hypothetical protein AC622_12460 [Bacillus sp. FJAT-27916]|uniref:RicAFT regulatory complex protein RicA family protein n=1 Tax=Bacillaceae TaxID=186817 RepID=UPI000670FCC4|nr:RicAFT regulatory complex protein RicA family protein [Bacillus sp. FJAT-27916]KMY44930.1 hypothetical protein AC622_12460 [Bacillus sp. FJAT-27916]
MEKFTKEQIIDKARDLARMISETEEVDFFKRAEEQINGNQTVAELMSVIKGLQKQAVNFQHYGKTEALKKTEEKLAKVERELDEIPVVQEFKQSQVEVNDMLQMVANVISNTVTDEIIKSTEGDLLHGKTGSKLKSEEGSHSC